MPHTKHQIKQLLQAANISLRRRWGQNFLIDLNLMRLLVEAAELKGDEIVLEVGCGTGSLTSLLAQAAAKVIAVEIDPALAQIAREELNDYPNVSLLCTDILDRKSTIASAVIRQLQSHLTDTNHSFCMIANLPYQIASPLIVNLLLDGPLPNAMFFTVQKEVAQRMTALPGEKAYGLLSILMQCTGRVEQLRTISPEAFWPRPGVFSAMMAWRCDQLKCSTIKNINRLKQLIDILLGHRRKKIITCLRGSGQTHLLPLLPQAQIEQDKRGETIPPEKFVRLANLWQESST